MFQLNLIDILLTSEHVKDFQAVDTRMQMKSLYDENSIYDWLPLFLPLDSQPPAWIFCLHVTNLSFYTVFAFVDFLIGQVWLITWIIAQF